MRQKTAGQSEGWQFWRDQLQYYMDQREQYAILILNKLNWTILFHNQSMIFYKKCPVCGSTNLLGYAIDCLRNGPHMSRVKCGNCDIVFANPMADAKDLEVFYTNYFHKGNFGLLDYTGHTLKLKEEINAYDYSTLTKKASHIYNYKL
ncbi:MAG TPA: hypothetical protein VJ552_13320 [Sediminibacterium sp.]|nr:hypothetical protein [Sediminibacterium sp.]